MAEPSFRQSLENEPALVEKAKTDDQAFAVLYHHYFPKIYGYLFKRTGSREITEDLVSETFMKVFCHLGKYHYQGHSFGAWLFRIATNNLIDYYRKQGKLKTVDLEQIAEPMALDQNPTDLFDLKTEQIKVQSVLKKLHQRYQEVLYLKFFAEFSTLEIAETLVISENNARVLIHRALKTFDQEYKKYGN